MDSGISEDGGRKDWNNPGSAHRRLKIYSSPPLTGISVPKQTNKPNSYKSTLPPVVQSQNSITLLMGSAKVTCEGV